MTLDKQILLRFLTKRCSAEEMEQIDAWIDADPANANWLFEMEQLWSLKEEIRFSEKKEIKRAYRKFMASTRTPHHRVYFPVWSRYAAAVAILFVCISVFFFTQRGKEEITAEVYNRVEVPKGQRVSLVLSDGTKVWLNADSKFSYPARFSENTREVYLEGEGFFEVTSNNKKPFIVNGPLLNIKVLGTVFNVKAYKDETTEVSLKEGKIEVFDPKETHEIIAMVPNEQILYTVDKEKTLLQQMDMTAIDSWTRGDISFVDKPLSFILKSLERMFDTQIILMDEELADVPFQCRAKHGTPLLEVLDNLKKTKSLNYKTEENKILIYKM